MHIIFIAVLTSFILSIITGYLLIPILKKLKANQNISKYLERTHSSKNHTPTIGGLIFILPTLLITFILYLLNKIELNYTLIIVIFSFISYSIIGFIDDYLKIKRQNNDGLTESQKLIMQIIIALIFFYLFLLAGNEPLLWVHLINFKKNIGFFYGIFILLVLLGTTNAVNLTDGLDGLAAGLSIIALSTFGIITYNTEWLNGYIDLTIFIFVLVGSLLGFLFFNINPAKIFMGDTGSLALGSVLASTAIITRHELLLIIIGIVFVIEMLTTIIQRIYYKITKKRLFLMTPIHHTFEKKGINERDIVKIFWSIGLVASLLALIYGVILWIKKY